MPNGYDSSHASPRASGWAIVLLDGVAGVADDGQERETVEDDKGREVRR